MSLLAAIILLYPLWRIGTKLEAIAWNLKVVIEDERKRNAP